MTPEYTAPEVPLSNQTVHKGESMLKSNVGGIDRILRIVAGIVLIALTLMGVIGMWGWIGIVPLATGLFRTCPIYSLLGFSTCPVSTTK